MLVGSRDGVAASVAGGTAVGVGSAVGVVVGDTVGVVVDDNVSSVALGSSHEVSRAAASTRIRQALRMSIAADLITISC